MTQPDASKPRLKEKVYHEAKSFAIIFAYVWVIISLFVLYKSLILERHVLSGQGLALINAFVLAKVILVLELFKIGDLFYEKPPIIRILFKAALYGFLLLLFFVLEEAIRGWIRGETFHQSIADIGSGNLSGMWILGVITSFALVPYLICREIGSVIGYPTLVALIFYPPEKIRTLPVVASLAEEKTKRD